MFEPGSAAGTIDTVSPSTEPARRVSAMSDGMSGSEILRIAGEIRAMTEAGQRVCNLTVGDFSPAVRAGLCPQLLLILGDHSYPNAFVSWRNDGRPPTDREKHDAGELYRFVAPAGQQRQQRLVRQRADFVQHGGSAIAKECFEPVEVGIGGRLKNAEAERLRDRGFVAVIHGVGAGHFDPLPFSAGPLA